MLQMKIKVVDSVRMKVRKKMWKKYHLMLVAKL